MGAVERDRGEREGLFFVYLIGWNLQSGLSPQLFHGLITTH